MIDSITFLTENEGGKGYIYSKPEEPFAPSKRRFRGLRGDGSDEAYKQAMKEYREEKKWYNKHKGEYILPCAKNLIGKTFTFLPDKINILFGPNASGKTTIIKALAGNALISDGRTHISEPLSFGFGDEYDINKILYKFMGNTATVRWSGNPVYYENFENTVTNSRMGSSISGSILNGVGDELEYHMMKGKISQGAHSKFILDRVTSIISKNTSTYDIVSKCIESYKSGNEYWRACAERQEDYLKAHEDYDKSTPWTLLLDEIDKSMDITSVIYLYKYYMPEMIKNTGAQVIMVSHNPIILSKLIRNNDMYNIIPIDEEYYGKLSKQISQIF